MIETLQSLRFIFVLMIFMSHFTYRGICAFDAGGDCGVSFFFILSGFVLSLGYGSRIREGTFCYGRFMLRRLRKIYPLHLLCLLFFLVVSRSDFDLTVLLNELLLQSWVPDPNYYFSCNSVSWFLSSLLFCYLVFPPCLSADVCMAHAGGLFCLLAGVFRGSGGEGKCDSLCPSACQVRRFLYRHVALSLV